MTARIRVFIAMSLDGFIAGPDDDLSWLPAPDPTEDYGYAKHMEETAAIVMGRKTYDIVAGFGGEWPYGETPLYVVTSRELEPAAPSVRAISGSTVEIIAKVQAEHEEGGIYLDGGEVIRGMLDTALVDEITITIIPVILGTGTPLFAGTLRHHELELVEHRAYDNGLVQIRYEVAVN